MPRRPQRHRSPGDRPPRTRWARAQSRSRARHPHPARLPRPHRPAAHARRADAFLADQAPDAYEKVVDRLLASPHYGERMAMSWLDGARYADTNGYQADYERSMWPWRDWVIDAFNRDMPFDRFTIEQIAGDLMPDATQATRIATGFNRNHRINTEGGVIPEEWRVETVIDPVETTGQVWLGRPSAARAAMTTIRSHLAEGFLPLLRLLQQRPREGQRRGEAGQPSAPAAGHRRRRGTPPRRTAPGCGAGQGAGGGTGAAVPGRPAAARGAPARQGRGRRGRPGGDRPLPAP